MNFIKLLSTKTCSSARVRYCGKIGFKLATYCIQFCAFANYTNYLFQTQIFCVKIIKDSIFSNDTDQVGFQQINLQPKSVSLSNNVQCQTRN